MLGTGSCSTSNTSTQAQASIVETACNGTASRGSGLGSSNLTSRMSQMVVESTTTDSTTTFSVPAASMLDKREPQQAPPSSSSCFIEAPLTGESHRSASTCASINPLDSFRLSRFGSGAGVTDSSRETNFNTEPLIQRASSQDMSSCRPLPSHGKGYRNMTSSSSTSRANLLTGMDHNASASLSGKQKPNHQALGAKVNQEKRASETIQLTTKRGRSMGSTTLAPIQMIKLQAAQRQISHNETTTRLLIAVMIVFLICEFPAGILALLCAILGQDFFENVYEPMGTITDLLALINSSVNFILYCFMSTQFRVTFYRVVLHCPAPNLNQSHHTQAVVMPAINQVNDDHHEARNDCCHQQQSQTNSSTTANK